MNFKILLRRCFCLLSIVQYGGGDMLCMHAWYETQAHLKILKQQQHIAMADFYHSSVARLYASPSQHKPDVPTAFIHILLYISASKTYIIDRSTTSKCRYHTSNSRYPHQSDVPLLLIPVAAMGKCKHIKESY